MSTTLQEPTSQEATSQSINQDSLNSGISAEADVKAEIERCAADFVYFCKTWVRIEDKETHADQTFDLWPKQIEVALKLVAGEWLWILKARQLGLTWLLAAFAVWRMTFFPQIKVFVLCQDSEYASDFLGDKVDYIIARLPAELLHERGKSNETRLQFLSSESEIRCFAATRQALRSLTGDLVIFDEGAYFRPWRNKDLLAIARKAAQPGVEKAHGQIVVISTSDGPHGEFYEGWRLARTGKSRYTPIFLEWRADPNRDQAWYDREAAENEADPLYCKREYPATPEEAFESAQGRIYPRFVESAKFIRQITVHPDWERYRAIDFGGVDPFVCLWACVVPGDGPQLTIDPSCTNLRDELLAYSYDENDAPADEFNHACDALRYLVVTPGERGIVGHLHVYRELYIKNSAALGLSLPDLALRILDEGRPVRSGGVSLADLQPEAAPKKYKLTVADRSRPDSIVLLNNMGIRPCVGQRQISGGRGGEIIQGIVRVNALIVGSDKGPAAAQIPKPTYPGLPPGMQGKGIYG